MGKHRSRRKATSGLAQRAPWRFEPRWALILLGLFVLSLAPRLYGGLTFGRDLDGPGTWRIVNYDEAGSCRSVLGSRTYPTFVGHQIIPIATWLGKGPPRSAYGGERGKSYCQSRTLITIQRIYTAVVGALTVVLLGLIALMMWPTRPQIAWTASLLLGLSNFHVAHSHSATVDAPQVFFIYLFTAVLVYAIAAQSRWALFLSPLFLAGAIWAKWYFFAVFAYAALLPKLSSRGNAVRFAVGVAGAMTVAILLISWDTLWEDLSLRATALLWGNETSRFGTGYANIGVWRRWIRNAVNLPVVFIVGLGLPACLFVWNGLKRSFADSTNRMLWLAHAPALAYAAYMLVLGPVTYYRYYLPLFPTVILLAAYGLWESRWSTRKLFLGLFFLYPLLLTVDSEYNYRSDPRRELRSWYASHSGARTYVTFYVVPPSNTRPALFNMDDYLRYGKRYLAPADYVVLSENWYDTSFPNELNGPIAWNPKWLIKTKPEYALAYRKILSGQDPNLEFETTLNLKHFMPEFLVHQYFYGSFQLFVGDLKIYRIADKGR